jgi:hypothetical protein
MRRKPQFYPTSSASCVISGTPSQARVAAACPPYRRYIQGQNYTLFSRKENLTLHGKRAHIAFSQ